MMVIKIMIIGDYIGFLHYFENTAGVGNTANFILNTPQYGGIDIGNKATPQLIDLNRDSLLDLVIGNKTGFFSYYENTGTLSVPTFNFVTDSLGKVNTKTLYDSDGSSVPFVYEEDGAYKMMAGANNGNIYIFGNIEGNLNGTFTVIDSSFQDIREGGYSAVSLDDINNDGYLDMIIGNYTGGLAFYKGALTLSSSHSIKQFVSSISIYPNPTKNIVRIDVKDNSYEYGTINIINILGETIESLKVTKQVSEVNLERLTSGIYFISFSNEKGTTVRKIIKE